MTGVAEPGGEKTTPNAVPRSHPALNPQLNSHDTPSLGHVRRWQRAIKVHTSMAEGRPPNAREELGAK